MVIMEKKMETTMVNWGYAYWDNGNWNGNYDLGFRVLSGLATGRVSGVFKSGLMLWTEDTYILGMLGVARFPPSAAAVAMKIWSSATLRAQSVLGSVCKVPQSEFWSQLSSENADREFELS